jgi:hypothetical protein
MTPPPQKELVGTSVFEPQSAKASAEEKPRMCREILSLLGTFRQAIHFN